MMALQPFIFAVAMAMAAWFSMPCSALADLATGAAASVTATGKTGAPADYSATSGVLPWSAIMERSSTEAGGFNDRSGDSGLGIANAIKDAVKPMHEELSQSGIVQSIRKIEADMGGARPHDATDRKSPEYSTGRPDPGAPAKSPEQTRREQHHSALMMDDLIKEIMPWLIGLLVLLAVGYLMKTWLTYLRKKAGRAGKLRRFGRRKTRHRLPSSSHDADGAHSSRSPQSSRSGRSIESIESSGSIGSSRSSGSGSGSSSASGGSTQSRRHRSHRS